MSKAGICHSTSRWIQETAGAPTVFRWFRELTPIGLGAAISTLVAALIASHTMTACWSGAIAFVLGIAQVFGIGVDLCEAKTRSDLRRKVSVGYSRIVANSTCRAILLLVERHLSAPGQRSGLVEYMETIRSLQSNILADVVRTAVAALACEEELLHANWMIVERDGDVAVALRLVTFDRENMTRGRNRRLSLGPDSPDIGAVRAYHHREATVIKNIYGDDGGGHFDDNRPYRSILSIPIFIPSDPTTVIGVVNLDSTRENHFTEELADELWGAAYLIGLLEVNREIAGEAK